MSRIPHWVAVTAAVVTLVVTTIRAATLPDSPAPARTPAQVVATAPATAPVAHPLHDDFADDEDAAGRIDVSDILGDGWYLVDIGRPDAERDLRRLLAVHDPGTADLEILHAEGLR